LGTWGHKEKAHLPSQDNLSNISSYLKSIDYQILLGDYKAVLPNLKQGEFLYLDPPYDGSTTFYTANKFSQEDQTELLTFLQKAESKGAKWLVSNHATEFILSLYDNYSLITTETPAFNKGTGAKRTDVLIKNY
jgi:DNA adenine methylase